ncbi:hypothetical protein AAVH_08903 [Aphelenchoides avenae]|nr:hypothetical protein AAVH_08903 [Aphelenchus avenae]
MDTNESTLEHIDELAPNTRTGGYEDFEVRLDNAEDADARKQMDVNDGCQEVGDSSAFDENGGIVALSNRNITQEAYPTDVADDATTVVASPGSFSARFGRSDGPMSLVRSEHKSQNSASPLSHRSVYSSNDIAARSMDEEDRTESVAVEHQTVAEAKPDECDDKGRRCPGRPQWPQSWTGGHAIDENLLRHCGAMHASTFSLRSIDVECRVERLGTAQPKAGDEKLEGGGVSSSFGTRWRQPRRPEPAQSWTVVRAVDEAAEHTSKGLTRDASALRHYESEPLSGESDRSGIANR